MDLEWEASGMFPGTHYCGKRSPGCMYPVKGTWRWNWYGRPGGLVDLGPNLETAKRCVEAMILLEGQ